MVILPSTVAKEQIFHNVEVLKQKIFEIVVLYENIRGGYSKV